MLNEDARKCVRLLFNRSGNHLFIAKAAYGDRIWIQGGLDLPSDVDIELKKPIGLVLDGALEVTERFGAAPHHRIRTTKILRPGEFFALFESVGGLRGQWEITSGVQRFLISNRLGNHRSLSRAGWNGISEDQLNTLKHGKQASYDYAELVHYAMEPAAGDADSAAQEIAAWQSTILVFDMARIRDNEALIILYQAAVDQLVSLARQNPADAMYEDQPEVQVSAEEQRAAAALDAILSDDVPIFALHETGDAEYGPFDQIKQRLQKRLTESRDAGPDALRIHLWIPDYWSRIGTPGGLYLDALAGRFIMERATGLLLRRPHGILRSGTRLEVLARGDDWAVRMTSRGGKCAIVQRLSPKRQGGSIPSPLGRILFADGAPSYTWPPHLSDGFFLEKVEA
jgi:hypothetical protein